MLIHDVTNNKYYWYGHEVTEARYNEIIAVYQQMPVRPGYWYKLLEDLTWKEIEDEPQPYEPTAEDKAEAFDILTGVSE